MFTEIANFPTYTPEEFEEISIIDKEGFYKEEYRAIFGNENYG